MEIFQASIKNAPAETKIKLSDDLCRLLQVREKNQSMSKDWLLFLNDSPKFNKLTAGEIYLAFKMAISRDLLDSKGDEINLLPELSINATGKVLTAYLEFKRQNQAYQVAKENLLAAANKQETTAEQKAEIREKYLQTFFESLAKDGFYSDAWILYQELKDRIQIPEKVTRRLYAIEHHKYLKETRQGLKIKEKKAYYTQILEKIQVNLATGKPDTVVVNRCKSIVVCHYLRKFKTFDDFKSAVYNG